MSRSNAASWDEIPDATPVTSAPDWMVFTGRLSSPEDEWHEIKSGLGLIDPGKWQGVDAPEREWAWTDNIPHRQATYLTGPGSAGKSLFGQQLATCHALGRPFLGIATRGGAALYLTCEDDELELHRRQLAICLTLGASPSDLSGKLHFASLAGELATELFALQDGKLDLTKRFQVLEAGAIAMGTKLIVLDNVAHLFGGNENARHEVAAFVSLLNRLAMQIDGAVLLIGHPNKAGDSFSGSTAWENQVRSRLFMEVPADSNDSDVRVLSRQKSNYARKGEAITFRWHNWAFVRDEDLPADTRAEIAGVAAANGENEAFMLCLAAATANKRAVSHNPGVNYAPTIFAKMAEAKGLKRAAFERAFERLLHLGLIELDAPLWQDAHRHWKQGIKASEKCGNPPAGTPCGDLREPPAQPIENTSRQARAATPPYINISGGAFNGPPPDSDDIDWGDSFPNEEVPRDQ